MKFWIFTFVLCFFYGLPATAQEGHSLEGRWEGVITKNGLETDDGYKFELFLEVENGFVKGRSYIHLSDTLIVEMDISGRLYGDRSVYIEDINYISSSHSDYIPNFARKYQFLHNRSVFGSTLEGYWQQKIKDPFNEQRNRGRILLKKIKSKV